MRGHPWGHLKWAKWAKNPKIGKIGKNWQKFMKNNEKYLDFLFEISATILQPPHHAKKDEKNVMGWPMGVHKHGKSHKIGFYHHMACCNRG